MAISSVKVKINGVWTNLSYNEETGLYEGTITAPAVTSFGFIGGYYPATLEVSNDAGTVVTKTDTDDEVGDELRLFVRETVKPVIVLESPTNGAYIQNNSAPVIFSVTDETYGSGIKEDSIVFKLDNISAEFEKESITNGYRCTYTPAEPLDDGVHTVSIEAEDNDGNIADPVESSYTVDTVPPTLDISAPNFAITNNPTCTVQGITNDATSSPVSINIILNGIDAGEVIVADDGSFSAELDLVEGDNTIVVTSIDASGRQTVIEKLIKLDTTIPEVKNIKFEPNPVDTSQLVRITLQVE